MGLTCPKCGADNLLNAIFCRQCHEKLDLSAMKPEQVAAAAAPEKKGAPLGQKIFVSVFFGLVIIIGGGMICPSGGAIKGNEPAPEIEKAYKRVKKGSKPKDGGKAYTFTSEEASAALNKALGFPRENGDIVPTNLTVSFQNDNVIRVVLGTKLFGFLPMDNCLKFKYTVSGKGKVETEVLSAKIGQVPMITGGLKNLVLEKIQRATGCNNPGDIQDIIKNTKASNCTEGSITIEP